MNRKKYFLIALMSLTIFASLLVFSYPAISDSYDIKELTPEVKSALDSRRERFDQIKAFKAQGVIGENNKGYVEVLAQQEDVQQLVAAENKDRKFIYTTIVQQNNLPEDALATVETVFAQVQRDKASPGDKIQDADGNWVAKQ